MFTLYGHRPEAELDIFIIVIEFPHVQHFIKERLRVTLNWLMIYHSLLIMNRRV